jgi:predicted nucleic acid-binding protein
MAEISADGLHSAIVVDTSAVMAVLLNEPHRDRVIELTAGADLVAPASLSAEIGNALSALMKRKRLGAAQARQVVSDFQAIPLSLTEIDLEASVALAASLNVYAYDAYMLTTALSRGLPLLTLDGGLAEAGRRANVNLIEVT